MHERNGPVLQVTLQIGAMRNVLGGIKDFLECSEFETSFLLFIFHVANFMFSQIFSMTSTAWIPFQNHGFTSSGVQEIILEIFDLPSIETFSKNNTKTNR